MFVPNMKTISISLMVYCDNVLSVVSFIYFSSLLV